MVKVQRITVEFSYVFNEDNGEKPLPDGELADYIEDEAQDGNFVVLGTAIEPYSENAGG